MDCLLTNDQVKFAVIHISLIVELLSCFCLIVAFMQRRTWFLIMVKPLCHLPNPEQGFINGG